MNSRQRVRAQRRLDDPLLVTGLRGHGGVLAEGAVDLADHRPVERALMYHRFATAAALRS